MSKSLFLVIDHNQCVIFSLFFSLNGMCHANDDHHVCKNATFASTQNPKLPNDVNDFDYTRIIVIFFVFFFNYRSSHGTFVYTKGSKHIQMLINV